jgi:long-chain acyl-CoA synthetase
MADRTVLDLFRHDFEAPRDQHYTHHFPGGTKVWSTSEFFGATAGLAEALTGLGVKSGDRVALVSDTRPEWHIADLAIADLGAVDVPIYLTLTAAQIAYQISDSGATVAIVENAAQADKLLQVQDSCPGLRHIVQVDGEPMPGVEPFTEFVASGWTARAGERFWERARNVKEDDLLTIIYTSGTTGEPKGVMLTHRNFVANVIAAASRVPVDDRYLALEFLPLCHVLERMLGYVYMWRATAHAYCSVYHVGELIAGIRPNIFAAVPRFYEKVQGKVLEAVGSSGPKAALFNWAIGVGREVAYLGIAGRPVPTWLALQHRAADRAVLSKVRQALGGRVRYCISGGAPLPLPVGEFFHAAGVALLEGYGLTETSPVISVNAPGREMLRLGTVGKPLDNLEVKIAEDGEVLVKGPSVMRGYWNKPTQTAEVFDDEGFFFTGDIGAIDDGGFLLITDRKKELIVTAGGKNVAPQPIEGEFKRFPMVDSAVIIGDGRPFIVALLAPNLAEVDRWAHQHGVSSPVGEALLGLPQVVAAFAQVVESVNAGLARYEQIKEFALLPGPLTLEGGHLTPTLKVKRRVIEREYAALVEAMYARPRG